PLTSSTRPPMRFSGFPASDLFRIRIKSRTGLAATDGAEDGDSGKQAPFWNREPVGCCRWLRGTRVVDLAEHEEQIVPIGRGWIHRRLACFWPRRRLQGENVESRQKERINNVGSRVQKQSVGKLQSLEERACPEEDEFEEEILLGKGIPEIQHDP